MWPVPSPDGGTVRSTWMSPSVLPVSDSLKTVLPL